MGEIPDRSVFFGEGMRGELRPYLEIAQAVRRGDLAVFHETVGRHAERLRVDGTYTLISRLAHSVVKAGLRRLKTSYSRISLDDVASRLGLPSATSAEFVVAKAVRDGVIDATIDHEGGYVQSHDLVDVYATIEPSEAFHRRIAYCLTTHNDAVRAMRYTPDAYKKQLEASRGLSRRGREDKTDEEKAQEIEDELDDEDYEY
jgi:26S proteasome regulatory subunit N3